MSVVALGEMVPFSVDQSTLPATVPLSSYRILMDIAVYWIKVVEMNFRLDGYRVAVTFQIHLHPN